MQLEVPLVVRHCSGDVISYAKTELLPTQLSSISCPCVLQAHEELVLVWLYSVRHNVVTIVSKQGRGGSEGP